MMGDAIDLLLSCCGAAGEGRCRTSPAGARRAGGSALKLPSRRASTQAMNGGGFRLLALVLGTALFTVLPALVSAQEDGGLSRSIEIRPFSSFAPSENTIPLALGDAGEITLTAKLTEDGEKIGRASC